MNSQRAPSLGRRRLLLVWLGLASAAVFAAGRAPAAVGERLLVALESPGASMLGVLAARSEVDVRWVEPGLVLAEVAALADWPAECGGRVVARFAAGLEIGLVRGGAAAGLARPGGADAAALDFVRAARVATLATAADDLWVAVAAPGTWPANLTGCHGPLFLPGHHLDPRSLIDAGPPAVLAGWVAAPFRTLTVAERRAVDSISAESLMARVDLLALAPGGAAADRYVFDADLGRLYELRAERLMQRFVQGIPDAWVRRQSFAIRRNATQVDSSYNLVAHLPGSAPEIGTFVVGAHIDATGSSNADWRAAVAAGRPVQTPGAEDNATGVACVLEMLRVVSDAVRADSVQFACNLEFAAFSAEELGLVGSEHYVERGVAEGATYLGTFNMDMVGYDSLRAEVHVAYNPASHWLVNVMRQGLEALQPPSTLLLREDLDVSRASDHNSFWAVNAPAVLTADAPVSMLRNYPTYHQPSDVRDRVRSDKLAEVARFLTASLMRFDTRIYATPRLLLAPEDLALVLDVRGQDLNYSPALRLWPGAGLKARLRVHSLGAPYSGPLRVEMWTEHGGARRSLLDEQQVRTLPTAARQEVVQPVAVLPEDVGRNLLRARVTYRGAGGADVVQTAVDTFQVEAQESGSDLGLAVVPNPVRGSASQVQIAFEALNWPGELRVEIYDLEGQRLRSSTMRVSPNYIVGSRSKRVNLLANPGEASDLDSGTYVVRLQWRSDGGNRFDTTRTLVVIR